MSYFGKLGWIGGEKTRLKSSFPASRTRMSKKRINVSFNLFANEGEKHFVEVGRSFGRSRVKSCVCTLKGDLELLNMMSL